MLSLLLDGKAVVECDPLGTDLYMSPEALKDRSQVGLASDIWSLGVLFFFSLVSRHVNHFRRLGISELASTIHLLTITLKLSTEEQDLRIILQNLFPLGL